MPDDFRSFRAGPDPFGKTWQVDYAWLQTGTAIRHADTVDVKFFLHDGQTRIEKIVAMRHPDLLELAVRESRPLTDPWCARLAAAHIEHMVATAEDMEKSLVTLTPAQLQHYAALVAQPAAGQVLS